MTAPLPLPICANCGATNRPMLDIKGRTICHPCWWPTWSPT